MTTGDVEKLSGEVPGSSQREREYTSMVFWRDIVAQAGKDSEMSLQKYFLNNKALKESLLSNPQCAKAAFQAAHEKFVEEKRRQPQKDFRLLDKLALFMEDLIEVTKNAKPIPTEVAAIRKSLDEYRSTQVAKSILEKSSARPIGEPIELGVLKASVESVTLKPQRKISMVEKVFKNLTARL